MDKGNRCQPLDPEPNSKEHKLTSNPQTSIRDPNQKPPKIAITNETLKAPNFNFPNSTLLTQKKKLGRRQQPQPSKSQWCFKTQMEKIKISTFNPHNQNQ